MVADPVVAFPSMLSVPAGWTNKGVVSHNQSSQGQSNQPQSITNHAQPKSSLFQVNTTSQMSKKLTAAEDDQENPQLG